MESSLHIWPKDRSLAELRKPVGRNGRRSWQKTVYGFEKDLLAGGGAVGAAGAGLLELVARGGLKQVVDDDIAIAGAAGALYATAGATGTTKG